LGRKVSDEFTVPLCRKHHQELHRHGNEATWWANMQVAPIPIANELWNISPVNAASPTFEQSTGLNRRGKMSQEAEVQPCTPESGRRRERNIQ
jgi:hypothetical protein